MPIQFDYMDDNRLRILKEAGILFSRLGIRAVTMDYIANHLGMSKRTLYELFSDKDDLLKQAIEEGVKYHQELMIDIINKSENVIDAIVKFSQYHHNVLEKIHPLFMEDLEKYHHKVFKELNDSGVLNDDTISKLMLNKGVDDGTFRRDININLANIFLHQTLKFCVGKENSHGMPYSKEDIGRTIFMPYLRGICTDEGLKKLNYANIENQS